MHANVYGEKGIKHTHAMILVSTLERQVARDDT